MNVVNLDKAAFLFVPPAPSSTTIKSDVVKSAPMSEAPSISNADNDTLSAVEIVLSLLSAILPANIEFSTEVAAIVTAPAFVIVTSPDNEAAVNPFPSPINICVSATAFAETTPELLASLTNTVFAAWLATFAKVTCASAM